MVNSIWRFRREWIARVLFISHSTPFQIECASSQHHEYKLKHTKEDNPKQTWLFKQTAKKVLCIIISKVSIWRRRRSATADQKNSAIRFFAAPQLFVSETMLRCGCTWTQTQSSPLREPLKSTTHNRFVGSNAWLHPSNQQRIDTGDDLGVQNCQHHGCLRWEALDYTWRQ